MNDRYMKIVLTIIAISLVTLILQNSTHTALAQSPEPCGGSPKTACWVQSDPRQSFYVSTVPSQALDVRVIR